MLAGIIPDPYRNGGTRNDEPQAAHRLPLPGDSGRTNLNRAEDGPAPTQRIGAYLRKMAIDGYIIYTDTRDIKEMNKSLSAISRNVNQIAKRLNAGGPAYQADMEEI